jgi:hypothetical protein
MQGKDGGGDSTRFVKAGVCTGQGPPQPQTACTLLEASKIKFE